MNLTAKLSFVFVALGAWAQPVLTVAPNSALGVEGNSASSTPFNQTGVRFQQVYSASEFGLVPGWIREIDFRVDVSPQGGQDFVATLPDIQINLSTTLRQPDSLSPVFAENVGLNDMIVRAGSLSIQGSQVHVPGFPTSFSVGIALTNRFFYDPAQGNLLLDVRNFVGAGTAPFDAVLTVGDSVSSVSSIGVNLPSGTPSTLGLATLFVIDPVPEPSMWSLVIAGLAAFGLFHRARKRKR